MLKLNILKQFKALRIMYLCIGAMCLKNGFTVYTVMFLFKYSVTFIGTHGKGVLG